jgi:hypothetical protein
MNKSEKILIKYYDSLASDEREMLLSFAEFLAGRSINNQTIQVPVQIDRPAEESIIAAIKRLSTTYSMIDKSKLLSEVSDKVTGHVVHGQELSEVIDELEVFFKHEYEQYVSEKTLMKETSTTKDDKE